MNCVGGEVMRTIALMLSSLLVGTAAAAQAPPAFEVASIRPSEDQPERATVGVRISGSQVRITYFSLRDYVSYATGIRQAQLVAPDWLAQVRFDIAAKLPDGASAAQVPAMLQQLLIDRFELKTHRASQQFDVELKNLIIGPTYAVHVELLAVGLGPANNILQAPYKGDFVKI